MDDEEMNEFWEMMFVKCCDSCIVMNETTRRRYNHIGSQHDPQQKKISWPNCLTLPTPPVKVFPAPALGAEKTERDNIGAEAEPKLIQKLIQRFVMFQFSSLMSSCI